MELRQLEVFVALAEHLHFRRTAQWLGIAQPNLTRTVKQLEQALGVKLFARHTRRVQLTEAGVAFLPEAQQLLAQQRLAFEAAHRIARHEVNELHVGFTLSSTYSVFPKLVAQFRRLHPDVPMHFLEASSADQERGILNWRLSAGLLYLPVYHRDLEHWPLYREAVRVVLPKRHRLARRKQVSLEDLADSPWIFLPRWDGPRLYDWTIERCRQLGFAPNIVHEVQLAQVGVALVAAGVGVYFTFASLQAMNQPGVVFKPLRDAFWLELALVWRKDNTSPALRQLIAMAQSMR